MAAPQQQGTGYASASLYVGDLAVDVTEALLFEIFNAVGPVASVRVCRDAATRRSLGYAYVNFHRVEDAERALETMNFTMIRNKACRIMWSHRDPSLRRSGAGNIFVKNLAKSIDNKTLYDTFSMFGNILSCKVATNAKRESLGYGFVHYESDESAKNAIERVNGMVIAGETVTVTPFKSRKERGGPDKSKFTNIYVKNLPEDYSKEQVDALFTAFGPITSSMIAINEGKSRGFGFVNMATAEAAAAAVDGLNGKEVGGKVLVVTRAQKKEEREKELRDQFERLKQERQKKYAGVNLYVKNLSDNIDDDRLREEFAKYGDITSAKVMTEPSSGKSRGFGFVCFATPDEATKAVSETNGKMVENKPLYVALAQRKEARRAQLEQQYAQHSGKMAMPNPGMYAPGGPMFYAPGPQGMPQRVMYPQQMGMPRRGWNPQQGGARQPAPQMMGAQMFPGMPGAMPVNGRPGGPPRQPGGRQGSAQPRQGGKAGNGAPKPGQPQQGAGPRGPRPTGPAAGQAAFKYTPQVRNSRDAMPGPVPPQAGPGMQPPLTIQALAAAPDETQKQMIGERLFPLIQQQEPHLAGKITGMLLEMDNGELLHLLESADARNEKIQEALQVLQQHSQDDVEGNQ